MSISQLRHLEQQATDAPWIIEPNATHEYSGETYSWPMIATSREAARYDAIADLPYAMPLENAALIVAMRNALPALLDVAEAADETRRADRLLEHKPLVTEAEHTTTTAWVYTADGATYSDDEHERRMEQWEQAASELDAALARLEEVTAQQTAPAE